MKKNVQLLIHDFNRKTYEKSMGHKTLMTVAARETNTIDQAVESARYQETKQIFILFIYSLETAGLITKKELDIILRDGMNGLIKIKPDDDENATSKTSIKVLINDFDRKLYQERSEHETLMVIASRTNDEVATEVQSALYQDTQTLFSMFLYSLTNAELITKEEVDIILTDGMTGLMKIPNED